ncbi:MAG: zf-HC2 domain-containing protein [Nitrospinaceae bacterium]|nr:zf-HC2 domain-containing protein [Nitrospinaceae bacterium]
MSLLMSIFKMTCKDVYPLISEEMDHSLSFSRRVRLKMHLAICNLCHVYSKQLQMLRNLARNLGKENSQAIEKKTLSPDTKEKLQKYIKEKI